MSMHYSTVVLLAIIISVIKSDTPTGNTCKYDSSTFPTENTDCVKTRMANGFACCYEQFTEGTTTKKYCVKEEITKTRTAETIKGEFLEQFQMLLSNVQNLHQFQITVESLE